MITIIINVMMVFAVLLVMNYVQKLLYTDVQTSLTEVVTQNKDVITTRLNSEMNNLENMSSKVSTLMKEAGGPESLEKVYNALTDENKDRFFVADTAGIAYFNGGITLDISGRSYYRLALDGIQNISDKTISRLNGDEVFLVSMPIYYDGKISGTAHFHYSAEEMYKTCELSLYSSQGFMYIINSDGYVLIDSQKKAYNQESDNYYRMLFAQGNKQQSETLQQDIEMGKTGFMEITENNQKFFSAYTSIEGIHDWYLITSVNTEAISANANIVIKMLYLILFIVVLMFCLSMFYFLNYKNKQQRKLLKAAFEDPLTKGNTFTKFIHDVAEIFQKNPKGHYALMCLDIDNFKYVNNYYGFDVGDNLLIKIYQNIQENLCNGETMARVSSDHFVVLIKNESAKRLNSMVVKAKENDLNLKIYFSVGVYEIDDTTESINLMMDKANAAARLSKSSIQKKVEYYTQDLNQQMLHSEFMKQRITKALANDEMVPYFQPKVDIRTRELTGAEALARWIDEDGNLIPPFEFISICEKTGMIIELDMMIFRKTLQFLKENRNSLKDFAISVNFSRTHLNDPHFPDKLQAMIHDYQVPPQLIEIELTESIMMDDHDMVRDFAKQVHEIGFRIAMDDFGSGYSSLNMLKDIPIDILKIDQVFLRETEESEKQKIILANIAEMASQLAIGVVVEGVEYEAQVELMKSIGCMVAQGYYYARPMDKESFKKIYQEGKV